MSSSSRGGFTIIEVLITTFLIGTVVTGLFGLFVLNLRSAQEGEKRVVAVALANERMEMVRNLPYADVGTVGGIPSGAIAQQESITRNGLTYAVATDIRYIDDSFDGTGAGDPINLDYKQVRVEVSWPSQYNARPVLLVSAIAPQGVEGGEVGGTLDFQALNALGAGVAGATVVLENSDVEPDISITSTTDDQGRFFLPGLPQSSAYVLTVTKAGYTSEQTYDTDATFVPDSDHTHIAALTGTTTSKTFSIDEVATVTITTEQPDAQILPNVSYAWRGTKTLGVDGSGVPVLYVDTTGTTDVAGAATEDNLLWDSYMLTIDGVATGYDIKETSLPLPLVVNPGDNVDLTAVLVPHTPTSLHVTVVTSTGAPVDNATVQVVGNTIDETQGTGVVGQVLFDDLPVNGDYALTVTAPSMLDYTGTVTVQDTSRVVVELASAS